MNLQTEYVEEHAANAGTMDLLEVETSERIRLERELNELRVSISICHISLNQSIDIMNDKARERERYPSNFKLLFEECHIVNFFLFLSLSFLYSSTKQT